MRIKVATAFSGGFGSVEMALKYLEIAHEVVFACEWLKPQRDSYIQNHGEPTSNFYKDICNLDGEKYKGQIDYYHLSPPCQEYSMAGNRGGADTDKGQLMFQAIKSIDEVQPKMFSVENVKGLLSSNNGEDWKNILKDFNSLKGYTISWGVMNAKEQGTPQNRERVFIVGFRGKSPMFHFPKKRPLKYVLKDLLEDEVDEKYFLSERGLKGFLNSNFSQEANRLQKKDICDTLLRRDFKSPKLIQVGNIDTKGHNSLWGRVYATDGIAPTQNAKGGGAGAKTGLYKINSNTKCGFEVATDGDGITATQCGKSKSFGTSTREDGIAYCLRACEPNGIIRESSIRRLTPRECARVQGDFEDKFIIDGFSDTKLYEFIGNAMDISTTKNLIVRMLEHLKNVDITKPKETTFIQSVSDKQKTLF